ncbi:hypothetical protein MKZ02_22565 [Pseudobacillus sp. FSL P4-0506]|uniref:hypothetical protein n=1 Tax=unclassified Pseudobacillus TaxID=2619284 RepID=UPI0030F607A1
MDIKIRKIDVAAVKKIDQMAKKKNLSRNEFLKIHLEKLAYIDPFIQERNQIEESIHHFIAVLGRVTDMVKENNEEVKKLKTLFLMMMDTEESEVDQFMNIFGGGSSEPDKKNL